METKRLSALEISQRTKPQPIEVVAAKLGVQEHDLELYGKLKAKLSLELCRRLQDAQDAPKGQLIGHRHQPHANRRGQNSRRAPTRPGWSGWPPDPLPRAIVRGLVPVAAGVAAAVMVRKMFAKRQSG